MNDLTAYKNLKVKLADQVWRLNHLYKIKDVNGNCIQFKMNYAQEQLYNNLHYFNVILKARQLGFTTFVMIYFLDCCLFNSNQSCGVIAHTKEDTEELFKNKIRFAYDNLPDWLRHSITAKSETAKKLEFSNGSSIVVGTSLRGGTFQKLHISEYGKIAARYPEKAIEIKTGALNTVHINQQIVVESTAEGRHGEFFELCEVARKLKDEGKILSSMDPKFHFFPWFDNPYYKLGQNDIDNTSVTKEMADYFATLNVELTAGQKAWYIKKAATQHDKMKREFPSNPKEAFEASLEGAYYTKQMEIVRRNKQIGHFPHEPSMPVYTFWDLGGGRDSFAIWFMQDINNQYRFINYHESNNEGWEYYTQLLSSMGYSYAEHYLPHDGNNRIVGKEIQTTKQIAQQLGINPVRIVKRTSNVHYDIMNKCRLVLPRCYFDEERCALGIAHLDAYRKEWDDKLAVWKDKPRHDASSHCSDSFRTFAVGYQVRNEELMYLGSTLAYAEQSSNYTLADTEYNMFD